MQALRDKYDYIVIGAGISGLSLANKISLTTGGDASILVVEKENTTGIHASGRNSGVLHSGIYYPNKSFKAKICADGAQLMSDYCIEKGLPFHKIGKVVIPTKQEDDPQVDLLYKRASLNGASVEIIDDQQLQEIEPACHSASGRALFSPKTSVVDPKAILHQLRNALEDSGVVFCFGGEMQEAYPEENAIKVSGQKIKYGMFYNAAGQYADHIAKMFGVGSQYTILPFRGEYYRLLPSSSLKLNHLIYPVPDLNVPFLGIHSVTDINGDIYFGPSAIPVFGREHYSGFLGISASQIVDNISNLTCLYWSNSNSFRSYMHDEISRFTKNQFIKAAQKLVPGLKKSDLVKSHKVGIRAQLVNTKNNMLEMDFVVERRDNTVHVLNAVSPGFTCAFSLANEIVVI